MKRLQIESFAAKLYKIVDSEFELDTVEGHEVYKALLVTVFGLYAKRRNGNFKEKPPSMTALLKVGIK